MTPRRWMPMRLRLLLAESPPLTTELDAKIIGWSNDFLAELDAIRAAQRNKRRRNLARRSLKLRARPVSVHRSRPMRGLKSHPDPLRRYRAELTRIRISPVNTGSVRRQVSA